MLRRSPGPEVSQRNGGASLVRWTLTCAPQGACDSRWATKASSSVFGSVPGAIRIEIFALASGISTFDDPAMRVMSTPIALIDGCAHSRSATVPVPDELDTVSDVGAGPQVLRRHVGAVPLAGRDPSDRHVTVLVVQGREQPREGHHGVWHRASEHTGVQRVLQGAHADHAGHVATQSGAEDRLADRQVAHVTHDEDVALEQLRVSLDERLEVALGLLHPLEDQLDRAGRLAVEDPQGAQVGHQPSLVVGGTPTEDPAVLAGRDPGVGRPALLRRRGLHVVVGVEDHDRGALRPLDLTVDRREARGHLHQPRVGEPSLLEQREGSLGHLVHGLLRIAGEGDRRDGHQLLEVAEDAGHESAGLAGDLVGLHEVPPS